MAKEVKVKNNRHFFKDFKAELKKVIWPTPKQLLNNTVAVITIVILTAAIVFVLDVIFETVNNKGINRLKSIVSNTTKQNTTTSESEGEETNTTEGETENTEENDVSNILEEGTVEYTTVEDTNQVQE